MESEKVKGIKEAIEVYSKENKSITILRGGEIQAIPYTDILTLINELEKENKRLKRAINNVQKSFDNGEFISKDCKISGLKQFAERLKESAQTNLDHFMGFQKVVLVEQIDELLEEYKND